MEQNLEILSRDDTVFFWPKDSLFQYFLMMEALMENMCERCQLYLLVGKTILILCVIGKALLLLVPSVLTSYFYHKNTSYLMDN